MWVRARRPRCDRSARRCSRVWCECGLERLNELCSEGECRCWRQRRVEEGTDGMPVGTACRWVVMDVRYEKRR